MNIKGTNVTSAIVPFTDQDRYPTHYAKYGKGGYRSVQTIAERDAIPQERLEEGMVVWVIEDATGIHKYQYNPNSASGEVWSRASDASIPIVDQKMIDNYGLQGGDYITIPNIDSDFSGEIKNNTYKTSGNGSYVDVMFSAIRALQNEVEKLKNSFTYGIESYSGTVTAMSSILQGHLSQDEINKKVISEEPIWEIDESGLSPIDDISFDDEVDSLPQFSPSSNYRKFVDSDTYRAYLNITGPVDWEAPKEVTGCPDSKIFLYTITKSPNFIVKLEGRNNGPDINLNIANLVKGATVPQSNLYNTLIVVSRKQKVSEDDTNYYGNNFIWVSISDALTGDEIVKGYWNLKRGGLVRERVTLDSKDESGADKTNYKYILRGATFNQHIDGAFLYKLKVYSKWQDFSQNVIPGKPDDIENYKLKAAHITIRAVHDDNVLTAIKDQLLEHELVWVESAKVLKIKTTNGIVTIGSGSTPLPGDDNKDMIEEVKKAFEEMGITKKDKSGNLSLNSIEDVTFVNQNTGNKFKVSVDSEGKLKSQLQSSSDLGHLGNVAPTDNSIRGYIGQVRTKAAGYATGTPAGNLSDRLKIGAFYAPLKTDIIHGCSHAYVELENTSDIDIPLEGAYLHYTCPNESGNQVVYHLPLTGIIPAYGTYLIRGKQYAAITEPNVYLKVESYDQEWWEDRELVSFEIDDTRSLGQSKGYGFALTYGLPDLLPTEQLWENATDGDMIDGYKVDTTKSPYVIKKSGFIDAIYFYKAVYSSNITPWASPNVADIVSNSIYKNTFELDPARQAFQALTRLDSSRARWQKKDTDYMILRMSDEFITFPHSDEIYPISRFTPKASYEHKNVSTDKTKMNREKPNMVTCSFGIDIYKTRCFNWISEGYFQEYVWVRRKGDTEWTNRFVSYIPIQEINVESVQLVDVFDKQGSKTGSNTNLTLTVSTIGWSKGSSLSKYSVLANGNHERISSNFSINYNAETQKYETSLPGDLLTAIRPGDRLFLHESGDDLAGTGYPKKKFFDANVTNTAYARITGHFPGAGNFYTSHKVILDITNQEVSEPTVYEYVVGRANKKGQPDQAHSSSVQSFTLYPTSWPTQIYQITDQQGFHWIEYQVWAAVAGKLNQKIKEDQAAGKYVKTSDTDIVSGKTYYTADHQPVSGPTKNKLSEYYEKTGIIPILINTGDMTQNGTRINEWLDYYNGGHILFDHLEQMNIVGNNDLCDTDPTVLGTGDDIGKSNSYFFHLFYCYEIGPDFTPIIGGLTTTTKDKLKYIPSLYYFDSKKDRFLMVNSEITEVNARDWFNLNLSNSSNSSQLITVNPYTGFSINGTSQAYYGDKREYSSLVINAHFTPIYNMVYNCLASVSTINSEKVASLNKGVIVLCHEMPFTVITNSSLSNSLKGYSRSVNGKNKSLVGSHLNQLSTNEVTNMAEQFTPKGLYWFSRLLEYFKIKLVLGGHKHTYCLSYPVREYYIYGPSGTKNTRKDGPMIMEPTLKDDTVNFVGRQMTVEGDLAINEEGKDLSKFPLTKRTDPDPSGQGGAGIFYPCTAIPSLTGGIVYFMCQASGYKLTSNRELPSQDQKFTEVLPKTTVDTTVTPAADKPAADQKYPMFATIEMTDEAYNIKLARVTGIVVSGRFSQTTYSTDDMALQYLTKTDKNNFGNWANSTEQTLTSIIK